jgi:hypothetical protein
MITDPQLIRYSNEVIRPAADRMASLYYECAYLWQLAQADGDLDLTIQIREPQIRQVSDFMRSWVVNSSPRENVWFNVGTPSPYNTQFPNDPGEIIEDGSPDDGRPPISGADVHETMTQIIAYQSWMADAAFGGPGSGSQQEAMMNTIIVVGGDGNDPLQSAQVGNFVNNRCNEIKVEYEANNDAKLNAILKVAPNPRNPA